MGSISDYLETELMDHLVGNAYTQPTLYLALSTADFLDDGSGAAEPVGGNYARKAHAVWDVAATRLTRNDGVITFNQASGAWGLISHWGIFDALTVGNLLAHGSLDVSKDVVSGNTPSFADAEIEVSFDASAAAGG